jgi:molybdate/tungstate transport system substrate-binding protein
VFYAGVLKNAPHPELAQQFVRFLQSPAGQALLKQYGYSAPRGGVLTPAA